MALLIDSSTRDSLLGAEYLLVGVVVVNALLPRNGFIGRRLGRPYRRILGQALRVLVGVLAWPTVFFWEWVLNGGRLPLPDDSWTVELLNWPYGDLLWRALLLVASVVAWPATFVAEWTAWLVRRGAGGHDTGA
jgi:hypothetical protein